MPKETFFTAISPLESGLAARARCLGFLAGVAAPAALVSDRDDAGINLPSPHHARTIQEREKHSGAPMS